MAVLRTLLLMLVGLCLPVSASAITVRDIIELTKAGVGDEVLVALIDADRTIFTLDKEQVIQLKREGVTKPVLLKMIRSRREFDQPPVAPEAPAEEAPVVTTTANTPQPGLVIIGGNQQPEQPPAQSPYYPPYYYGPYPNYYVPYPIWGVQKPFVPRAPRAVTNPFASTPEGGGFGRFINDGWIGRR